MAVFTTHHLAACAVGIGASAATLALLPGTDWTVLGVTGLSGYIGSLLPDIDDENSLHARIVKYASKLAAIIVPAIQFAMRPTDLLIAIPLSLFMVSQFWQILHYFLRKDSCTHSVTAAVCLSLAVSWTAYLSAGNHAIIPAFIAAGVGYLVHLLLEDLDKTPRQITENRSEILPSLSLFGKGQTIQLYGILAIGFFCVFALWGI